MANVTDTQLAGTGPNEGARLVGFKQAGAGAVDRRLQAKAEDDLAVTDFGADRTGQGDATAAFNLATSASVYPYPRASSEPDALSRTVRIPSGKYKLGSTATDRTVFVRLGQALKGSGVGTRLELGLSTNTVPHIKLNANSANATPDVDANGPNPPIEIADFFIRGGSGDAASASIDTNGTPGWSIHHLFVSVPGTGIRATGSDGLIANCIFDIGLTHISLGKALEPAFNTVIADCIFFLGNYQIVISEKARDITISASQFCYFRYNALLTQTGTLQPGDPGLANINVKDCTFFQNEPYATSDAAIALRGGGTMQITGCDFRNLRGAGVRVIHPKAQAIVNACTFKGTSSSTGTASRTMRGIESIGGDNLVIKSCEFNNMRGLPLLIGGTVPTSVYIVDCTFQGNEAGTATFIGTVKSGTPTTLLIENVTNGFPAPGANLSGGLSGKIINYGINSFWGTINGNVLSISSTIMGKIADNQVIEPAAGVIPPGTEILQLINNSGGVQNYLINIVYDGQNGNPNPITSSRTMFTVSNGKEGNYEITSSPAVSAVSVTATGVDIFVTNSSASVRLIGCRSDRNLIDSSGTPFVETILCTGRGSAIPNPSSPTYVSPSGGTTIDQGARVALGQLAVDVASIRNSLNNLLAATRNLGLIAP